MVNEEQDARIARLTRVWMPLERCVANIDIFYANTGTTVVEGRRGTVRRVPHSGLVVVAWDDGDGAELTTSAENVDPVPS